MKEMRVRPKQIKSLTVALLVIAVLLPGVQLLARGAGAVTGGVLDANWRGAFDILVTDKGFEERVSPGVNEFGLGFLDPNYGGVAAPGLPVEKVTQVRDIAGVEVAAPLGYVGTQIKPYVPYQATVPWSQFEQLKKQTLRFNIVSKTNDGVSERVLGSHKFTFDIDITDWNGKYGSGVGYWGQHFGNSAEYIDEAKGIKVFWHDFNVDATWFATERGLSFIFWVIPEPATSIAAVDPVAEMALLGEAGEFLRPLKQAEEIFAEYGQVTAASFDEWAAAHPEAVAQLAQLPGVKQLQDYAKIGLYGSNGDFAPYISSSKGYAPTFIDVKFARKVDGAYVDIGESEIDLAELFAPFGVHQFDMLLPGADESIEEYDGVNIGLFSFEAIKAGALTLKPRVDDAGAPGFEVAQLGFGNLLLRHPEYKPDGFGLGDVRNYRSFENVDLKIGTAGDRGEVGVAPFNVGSYEPVTRSAFDVYTPLGLYENNPVYTGDGKTLASSFIGTGIALDSANAIMSLDSAAKMVDSDFIVSIRVRVAGLEGLTRQQAQLEIDKVAQQIRALGLGAKVVSGASQQEVSFWVPGYSFGTTDPKDYQEIADLGWVTQVFTVVGADQWTEATAVYVTTTAGHILLTLVIVALVVIMLLIRPARLRQQRLLKQLGYGPVFRAGWAVKESSVGFIALAVGVVLSLVLSSEESIWQVLAATGVVVVAVLLGIPVAHGAGQRLPSRFGKRRVLWGIAVLESVVAALCTVIVFALAQLAAWFWQTGSKLSLSRLVLESLMPVGVMVVVVLGFLVYLQFVASRFSSELLRARVVFAYQMLAQSSLRIMLRQIVGLVGKLLLLGALVAAAALYGLQWVEPETFGFLAAGLWAVLWVLVQTVGVLLLRPARLCARES